MPELPTRGPAPWMPVEPTYTSRMISIADTFLTGPPAKPVSSHPIDFAASPLPQYKNCTATVLENVLSPEECKELVRLAEASALDDGGDPWRPALVSVGPGVEVAATSYRNSDRIIWDQQTVVDRVWERCRSSTGLQELLATHPGDVHDGPGQWIFSRLNDRMRFLRYAPRQYFKPHIDGPYYYEDDGQQFQTFYTVHLYLNDAHAVDARSQLVGGATSFLSRDKTKRVDVHPKAGSVLIFQHKGLYHEGAAVFRGTKLTMRTDVLYRWVPAAPARNAN